VYFLSELLFSYVVNPITAEYTLKEGQRKSGANQEAPVPTWSPPQRPAPFAATATFQGRSLTHFPFYCAAK